MKISEVCAKAELTEKAVRLYVEKGLLKIDIFLLKEEFIKKYCKVIRIVA